MQLDQPILNYGYWMWFEIQNVLGLMLFAIYPETSHDPMYANSMIFPQWGNFYIETMQALCNLATINGAPLLNTSLWKKTDRGLCSTFAGNSTFTGLFCKKAFLGNNCIEKSGDLFVRATWRFFGGGGGKSTNASIEHSEAALEDVLLFYFQLDLETRVQVRVFLTFSFFLF